MHSICFRFVSCSFVSCSLPLLQRGLCWHEVGEFELALLDLSHSHSMQPSAAACNASGHAYRALRLLPQAIAEYQRVRELGGVREELVDCDRRLPV